MELTSTGRAVALAKLEGAVRRARADNPSTNEVRLRASSFCQIILADASLIEWTNNRKPGGPLSPVFEGMFVKIESDAS